MSSSSNAVKEIEAVAVVETKQGRMPSALVSMSRDNFQILQQKIFLSVVYAATTGIAERTRDDDEIIQASKAQDVRDDWRISARLLRDLSRYKSRNFKHFRESVMALNGRTVKPNILGKDDEEALDTLRTLFEGIGFTKDDNYVYFKFSEYVKIKIERLRFYCKFIPYYANTLKHTSSHAIYLLLLDYIDEKRGKGQTPFIEIDKFANLIGGEKYLSDFGELRKNSIEPAIDEITRETNIKAIFDRYEDVKVKGRKVTAIRIRGEYQNDRKNKLTQQTPSLFDGNTNANEITLFGYAINKEGFLDFISKDAIDQSAYKQTMRKALDEGTLGDLSVRVNKYISFKREQEKIAEVKREAEKANEFYNRLSQIAIKDKQSKIEELVILADNGFLSVAGFSKDDLAELANNLEGQSDKQIAKRLYTVKERELYEAKEYEYYQRTIIKPLTDVAPMNSWSMIIDGEETKVFYSAMMIKATSNVAALGALRKIERTIKSGVNVTFRSNGKLYLGAFSSDHILTLEPFEETDGLNNDDND